MAYRELTMIDVREVLRRRQAKQGLRRIARETGVDRKTVRRYATAAEDLGVSADEPLTDGVVHEVTQCVQARPMTPLSEQREALCACQGTIRQWLDVDGLRLTKVHRRLRERGVETSYATLRRFAIDVLDWRQPVPTVRLPDPPPAEEAQVDFGEMGLVFDPETQRRRKLHALIVTLSMSRYQFVWPTFRQTTEAVIEGLEAAWQFFGGVVQRIVPDNTKAIILKADPYAPRVQQVFSDYAQARGLFVDPARVRRPKDKARVERQVAYVRNDWFAGEQFDGLEAAREDAERWCRDVAGDRVHGTTRRVPRDVFEQEERAHLRPLPTKPYDVPHWGTAKVHPDYHIQVCKSLYSVPWPYRRKWVRVRADSCIVRIYFGTQLIKCHPRMRPGKRSTDPNDYPPGHQPWALHDVDKLIARAAKHGPSLGEYADRLLGGPLPWSRMRQVYKLLSLCDRYGSERVEAVCQRALSFDVVDVPRISRMLKSARRVEADAIERGKLRQLPPARFARDAGVFATLHRTEPEGGER